MTDKKRSVKFRKNNILLPHVDDAPQGALHDEEVSGGALRAQQTVDGLIRDLFGKEGGVGLAARGEDVPLSELDTKEVIAEEPVQEEPTPPETLEQIGAYPAFVQDDLQMEAELAQSEGYAQPLSFKEQIEASAGATTGSPALVTTELMTQAWNERMVIPSAGGVQFTVT